MPPFTRKILVPIERRSHGQRSAEGNRGLDMVKLVFVRGTLLYMIISIANTEDTIIRKIPAKVAHSPWIATVISTIPEVSHA